MKRFASPVVAACAAGALSLAIVAHAAAPAAAPTGEGVAAKVEVTAKVAKIDHKTREVTLKADDGQEYSFVASEEARNLDQVQVGDVVTITYAEAFVYEVQKGGQAADQGTVVAGGRAAAGGSATGVSRGRTACGDGAGSSALAASLVAAGRSIAGRSPGTVISSVITGVISTVISGTISCVISGESGGCSTAAATSPRSSSSGCVRRRAPASFSRSRSRSTTSTD